MGVGLGAKQQTHGPEEQQSEGCCLPGDAQIDADVDESRSVLRYMRRCCLCFVCSCCCDGDKDVVRDNTRAKRVKECALVLATFQGLLGSNPET